MAQLFFEYGAMGSGKTIELLKVAHNYELQRKKVLLMTPSIDTRSGIGIISSRLGLKRKAVSITKKEDLYKKILQNKKNYSVVLVDEAQFIEEPQVDQLAKIVDNLNIPVMAFGLRADAFTHLFPGSKRFFEIADKIQEVKTICAFCGKKAIATLRFNNGKPQYKGNQIFIGGNEAYLPVCRKHWKKPNLNMLNNIGKF